MKPEDPAITELGVNAAIAGPEALTVKVTALEVVLLSLLWTVTENVPAVAKSAPGMVAVNWVELTKAVGTFVLAH